ncbi:MAG: hypothetical protein QXL16_01120 [Candidatus Micrarchaeaceae archaeon]
MTEEEVKPRVEEIFLPGKATAGMDTIKEKIDSVGIYDTRRNPDGVTAVYVEARSTHKKPYLFFIVTIRDNGINLIYSIPPEKSITVRRAEVLKELTSMILLISDMYQVDQSKLLQYTESTLDSLLKGISSDYSDLFNKYDSLLQEYKELKKVAEDLAVSNRNLTISGENLEKENQMLKEELGKLQTYSDNALMVMVQEWIEEHNGSIDLESFSKNYNVPIPRIEQILDKMVSLGYIELKG